MRLLFLFMLSLSPAVLQATTVPAEGRRMEFQGRSVPAPFSYRSCEKVLSSEAAVATLKNTNLTQHWDMPSSERRATQKAWNHLNMSALSRVSDSWRIVIENVNDLPALRIVLSQGNIAYEKAIGPQLNFGVNMTNHLPSHDKSDRRYAVLEDKGDVRVILTLDPGEISIGLDIPCGELSDYLIGQPDPIDHFPVVKSGERSFCRLPLIRVQPIALYPSKGSIVTPRPGKYPPKRLLPL